MVLKKNTSQCTIVCYWSGDGVSEESKHGGGKMLTSIIGQLACTAVIKTKCGASPLSQKNVLLVQRH